MWGTVSLAEALGQAQTRSKGDIEFEIAQLEDQMSCAESEGEKEELHYAISNLYDELEG